MKATYLPKSPTSCKKQQQWRKTHYEIDIHYPSQIHWKIYLWKIPTMQLFLFEGIELNLKTTWKYTEH